MVWPLELAVTWQNYVASKCKITDGYVHSISGTSLTLPEYGGYGLYKQLLQQVITLTASQHECPPYQATSLMEERWRCLKCHHIHHPQDFSLWPQYRPLSTFSDCNTDWQYIPPKHFPYLTSYMASHPRWEVIFIDIKLHVSRSVLASE